jgi:hypothetical protein
MNWSKANFEIKLNENRLKVKTITGPKRPRGKKRKIPYSSVLLVLPGYVITIR